MRRIRQEVQNCGRTELESLTCTTVKLKIENIIPMLNTGHEENMKKYNKAVKGKH